MRIGEKPVQRERGSYSRKDCQQGIEGDSSRESKNPMLVDIPPDSQENVPPAPGWDLTWRGCLSSPPRFFFGEAFREGGYLVV